VKIEMPRTEKTKTTGKAGAAAKKSVAKAKKPAAKPKSKKPLTKKKKAAVTPTVPEKAQILSSEVVWKSPLFNIVHDKIIEPGGCETERDVIHHNGSVVILAVDNAKNKKNPWIVMERQYRHAANQFLWELPAGKIEKDEEPVAGAKRELGEETGYAAKKWKPFLEYFPSPGFLGESMKVFLAEGLVAGDAHPEEDEKIEIRLVKLTDVLKMIDKGMIQDGKTLTSVLLYARQQGRKHKK
jgi:ADP-ribose pyrophosphatase